MIYITLKGIDLTYYIQNILKLFYPNKTVFFHKYPEEDFRGIFISFTMDVCKEKKEIISESSEGEYESVNKYQINVNFTQDSNAPIQYQSIFSVKTNSIGNWDTKVRDSHEEKRIIKKETTRLLYKIISEHTGKKLPWGMLTGIRPTKIIHEYLDEGMNKKDLIDRLENFYFLSQKKSKLAYDVALKERNILKSGSKNQISLYIGIPFCTTRCLYCSFTSNSVKKYSKMIDGYLDTLSYEMEKVAVMIKEKGLQIQSVYIGGGTPTSIEYIHIKKLLKAVEDFFDLTNVKEYTLEAGRPDSIDEEKLRVIKNSKVDRISINPQTMKDETLKRIGRCHTAEDIIDTFKLARKTGFQNINMDIIAGLPGEKLEDFLYTLDKIACLQPESVTVHTMSIKRASQLNKEKENYQLIDESQANSMVDAGYSHLTQNGYFPYYLYRQKNILGNLENIGYSKEGFESFYNVQIMEERQTIIALGAGAITKVVFIDENRIERAFNVKGIEEYINRIDEMIKRKWNLLSGL